MPIVRDLALLVHPRGSSKNGLFAMFQAYFDESGIHTGARVCIIAGFYGHQNEWAKFDEQWNAIHRDYSLTDFHAKTFWARDQFGKRVSQYANLTDQEADKYLDRLIQCIQRARIFPTSHGIVNADWNRLPLNDRRYLTGAVYKNGKFRTSGSPNKSYYLPFNFCVLAPLNWCKEGAKVFHYFGVDRTFSKYAKPLYERMMDDLEIIPREKLGGCYFPFAKDTPGLQAADMVAYEAYQCETNRLEGKPFDRTLLTKIVKNMRPKEVNFLIDWNGLHRIAKATWSLNDQTAKQKPSSNPK